MLSSEELAELRQRAQEGSHCSCPQPFAPCDEYQNVGWCVTKFPVMPSTVLLLVETIEALAAERDEWKAMAEWLAEQAALGEWDELACRPANRRPPGYAPVILPDADGLTMPQRWLQAAQEAVNSPATTTTEE